MKKPNHLVVCLLGILALSMFFVGMTLRDLLPIVGALFLILPPHFTPVFLVMLLPLIGNRKLRFGIGVVFSVSLICLGYSYFSGPEKYISSKVDYCDEGFQSMLWTVDNYEHCEMERLFEVLSNLRLDAYFLIEGNVDHGRQKRLLKAMLAGYEMELLPHGMLLIHKAESIKIGQAFSVNGCHALTLELEFDMDPVTVVMVDHSSDLLINRASNFGKLTSWIAEQGFGKTIVLGDFNTPVYAKSLSVLRDQFDTYSDAKTWPNALPIWAIDQLWFSKDVVPEIVEVWDLDLSNHRPIYFEFCTSTSLPE